MKKPLREITGNPEKLAPIKTEPEKVDESYLAVMYNDGVDDEDDDSPSVPSPLKKIGDVSITTTHPKFNMVLINGVTYNFPNVKYMEALEKRVLIQDREILKLSNKNKVMHDKINQVVNEINDIWKELDKKINRRDMI